PSLYRTRLFPSGHFNREAIHEEDDETYRFTRESFQHFRSDPESGLYLDRLYFITRAGRLWGLSSAALTRIGFRVATDDAWQPDSESYLGKLLRWCQSLAGPIETPEVLRRYAATPSGGNQILLVGR